MDAPLITIAHRLIHPLNLTSSLVLLPLNKKSRAEKGIAVRSPQQGEGVVNRDSSTRFYNLEKALLK